MYLTQSNFVGKMQHPIPDRVIKPEALPDHEKFYPNRWMEERNLRGLHKRVGSLNLSERKPRELSVDIGGGKSHQLNVASGNQKYMAIVYEYVLPEHAWKVLKWLNSISDENKKVSILHFFFDAFFFKVIEIWWFVHTSNTHCSIFCNL